MGDLTQEEGGSAHALGIPGLGVAPPGADLPRGDVDCGGGGWAGGRMDGGGGGGAEGRRGPGPKFTPPFLHPTSSGSDYSPQASGGAGGGLAPRRHPEDTRASPRPLL